ncbi:bifunctional deaminase-reductase domain protein [Pseudarthrobacter chlorophenolicus A6]|uniref:Bifunctional deaminase-reductase domain protein n=1 Tax=Pseudarthrobacter chlorophenolicus (strain ATCC 700700 / DSM 12829 / CIP 107037 / JCM 12360 / KCTC 9906 / NCIMB 13794 / A6) TaxID=452863 RepID=B8HCE2_PSECP|nr:dihydrofolate reductase family protein [Pseudarthrobacter chlorophenolicus]ACL40558.1 bifunctional deaminase-reductase domain protein [Pseudarthrobacter chlorophenolicus A6]SDQ79356.1 Dihydrofolate reductase [Pseudarthrobacter chlorophenolicus]
MGIIVANLFITLDGVYQAPGGREEDPTDGFPFGGWQAPVSDEEAGADIAAAIDRMDALLLGRKTYDIFASYWPHQSDEIAGVLNRVPKFVVSGSLTDPGWEDTTVLPDAAAAGRLRGQYDEVQMFGSGHLIRSLLAADVLDRLHLWLYPVALGQGKRLFDAGTVPSTFRLAEPVRSFPKGAVSLVYEHAGDVETREMDAS